MMDGYAGRERTGNRGNRLWKASPGGSETACWTERVTVEIACRKLRWEKPYSMLDGEETVEIELRWEGARQHAGRRGNRANSLGGASPGGSETACWTERKPCK